MNHPEIYEKFVVPEGEKKVHYERDTKIAHAATLMIQREDHTVGDPLVMQLHEDSNVAFAAYKIPHPLEHRLQIKVKTNSRSTPEGAYNDAITCLTTEIKSIKEQFQERVVEMCGHADFAPHEKYAQQDASAYASQQPAGDYGDDLFGMPYMYQPGGALAFEGAG